ISGIVTHWFTLIVLSALRRSDNDHRSILTDLQGTLKGKWRYLIPAKPPIHNHVLIPNYQDFKIQDFCYSDGFECFQAIKIGRYEHDEYEQMEPLLHWPITSKPVHGTVPSENKFDNWEHGWGLVVYYHHKWQGLFLATNFLAQAQYSVCFGQLWPGQDTFHQVTHSVSQRVSQLEEQQLR
nr:hypothetical protein [Tanacetum cinerariifolium]